MTKESTQGIVIMVNDEQSSRETAEYVEMKEHLAIMEIMEQQAKPHAKKINFAGGCYEALIVILIAMLVSAIVLIASLFYYSVQEAKLVHECLLSNCTKK